MQIRVLFFRAGRAYKFLQTSRPIGKKLNTDLRSANQEIIDKLQSNVTFQHAKNQPYTANPVVLVPGYRDNASVFAHFVAFLEDQNLRAYPISLAPNDGRVTLEVLAGQIADFVNGTFAGDQSLDFVGYSMGGLVLRYYLQRLGGLERTHRFVTLGTPHRGTWTAYGSNRTSVRQMRPRSTFLQDLDLDADRLGTICFRSIWTPFDLMIIPACNSVAAVAQHELVFAPHHRALITSHRSLARVANALRQPLHSS